MAIFDRFVSRVKKEKSSPSGSAIRTVSDLDTAAAEAKEEYPDDSKIIDNFVWGLRETCRVRRKKSLEGYMEPMKAEAQFFLSEDRLTAYVCLLPPENDGEELTLDAFLEDIYYEGIVHGVLQEEVRQKFERGYFTIFPVARGTPPLMGEDGKVIDLFQRRGPIRLEVENGSQVDFSQDIQIQPVRKGTVICRILPPKPGKDGTDVTGRTIPCPKASAARLPKGENVSIDGECLRADTNGLLFMENDQFCILEQDIIEGDPDPAQGPYHISGSLYIGGNVDNGIQITASGDIVIGGTMGQARVESTGGTVRVHQGIYGTEGKTFLHTAGQLQAPVVEWAEINAGTSVIAETISNSVICCGGTVYTMTGRGMIVSSQIYAGGSILCLRVGNISGDRSRFSVGYPPQVPDSWSRLKAEAAEVQAIVEKLWTPITDLRKKGSRISDGEKALLAKLVEQRDLHLQWLVKIQAELKSVNQILEKKTRGKIRCEKLYPFLEVQIGKLTEEIITIEENCNIHVDEKSILLK